MKAICFVLFVAATAALVSCGASKQAQNQQVQQYPNYGGYYPQQPPQGYQQKSQEGPDKEGYVVAQRSPILELSLAVGTNEIRGYGQGRSRDEQLALNTARAQAVADLQQKIELYVKATLKQYVDQVGENSEYGLDESTRNQVVTAAKGVVKGARVLDVRKLYNPKEKLYKYEVCVTYDRAGVLSAMAEQSARIRMNEKRFEQEMKEVFDEYDALKYKESFGELQQ